MSFQFQLLAQDKTCAARRGQITTAHGKIQTPVFMPVGTFGAVKSMENEDLESLGIEIMLGNTYHLLLRPGAEILHKMGGYHNLIHWDRPILTDSGGFQVFSLPHQRTITEKGVRFKSYVDQSYQMLTPENNIAFQQLIGSDIMMVLDVCVPSTSPKDECVKAMDRTHRWALRCKDAHTRTENAMFGIVQGAVFTDLRQQSAEALVAMDFNGYAIGGLAVGETDEQRDFYTAFTANLLPKSKPRYLMGVGTPHDIVKSVRSGVDMFDCIIPTNHARQGVCYTWGGKVKLRRSEHSTQSIPIDANCGCYVCKRYSRAYLYQLNRCSEPTSWKLISYHNMWFYEELMTRIRKEILANNYDTFADWFLKNVPD